MARIPLIDRLPVIWRQLDKDTVLETFLSVVDSSFDLVHDTTKQLFSLRTVDNIPDRYLRLLGELCGHQWRTDRTYLWNRDRIRDLIRRYSYKGTYTQLNDGLLELGAAGSEVQDNASLLLTWGTLGTWGGEDSYWETADYYHDGAFRLHVLDQNQPRVNQQDVVDFVQASRLAGTVWYIEFVLQYLHFVEWNAIYRHSQGIFHGNTTEVGWGYGEYSDWLIEDTAFCYSYDWEPGVYRSYYPAVWHAFGLGVLEGLFTSDHYFWDVYWHQPGGVGLFEIEAATAPSQYLPRGKEVEWDIGHQWSRYNFYAPLFEALPTRYSVQWAQRSSDGTDPSIGTQHSTERERFATAQGYLTIESPLPATMDEIYANQGDPETPLTGYQASLQPDSVKTHEDLE